MGGWPVWWLKSWTRLFQGLVGVTAWWRLDMVAVVIRRGSTVPGSREVMGDCATNAGVEIVRQCWDMHCID